MLFKRKTYSGGISLTKLARQRFLKNKLALVAVIYISLTTLIAVLGYLITPDTSPFANKQILEIATHKPGSTFNFLLVKKNESPEKSNFLKQMFLGKKSTYTKIPYTSYTFKEDKIVLKDYAPETAREDLMEFEYTLADVCYEIQANSPVYDKRSGKIQFKTIEDELIEKSVIELQELVQENHLQRQKFLLGTDRYGRDYLSQLIIGARVSLSVGFIAVVISLIIGIFLGSLAGFFRGKVDQFIIWLINVVWSIPTLLLVIAITFALGKGFWQVFIAVGLTMWVEVARIVRGQILSIREKEFVEAGKALGFSNFRLIFYHILPNIMGPVIVISAANFASAILIEAGLSFLW